MREMIWGKESFVYVQEFKMQGWSSAFTSDASLVWIRMQEKM